MQQEQQVIQDKKDLEIEKLDREDANKEKDRQVELEIAEMKTLGQVEFQNPDSSDLIIQQAELQQKQLEHTNEVIDKEKQRQHEIKLKEKDIQSKKDTENKRTEAIKHQTDIQKQMADDQLAFKNKELNAKSKLEKLKIRKMSAKTDKNNKK